MAPERTSQTVSPVLSGTAPPEPDFIRVNLVGQSPGFVWALELIRRLAISDATVLIQGETGTGKELAARAIHYLGARRHAPFIPVNCGAIPDNLVESDFFGHRRGAFTDAKESRIGLIEQAQGGTLFLDEVEALSMRAQVVLLRFLQDHRYTPVGGSGGREASLRVIASSNADLQKMCARGLFRSDLLFRLGVLLLELPPLRDREGDAALLARRFVQRFSAEYGRPAKPIDARSMAYLQHHDWPGNVRELENAIHRAFLLSEGPEISLAAAVVGADGGSKDVSREEPRFRDAKASAIAEFERHYLTRLLQRAQGNISQAARLAGKERSRLTKLLKKHGLDRLAFTRDRG